ncbi:MAG: FtsQ-type POTRA domain-containing protein [Gammaproteobacteria bacterium]|nr:FtsQ-type POTRA domain-containing protein [Gammaproteobacteria bacterium]
MVARASQQAAYPRHARRWHINWRLLWAWCLLLVLVVLLALGVKKLQDPQTLPIKQIQVLGTFAHIDQNELRKVVAKTVRGGYFNVNVDEVQQAVKAIPWVDNDSVRRIWPDTLAIEVSEQQTQAVWAKGGLVNLQGVLFFPARDTYPKGLPLFDGPSGTERNLTETYQLAKSIISPLQLQIQEIHMDSRRAISLKLDNGIEVILGRDDTRIRLERFTRVYRKLLAQRANDIARVDLRYSNGLAVGWRTPHTS